MIWRLGRFWASLVDDMQRRKPWSRDEIRQRIRAAGLRSTAARLAVYDRLQQLDAPASHADIADALSSLGFDRATIYRNLMDLTDAGLAKRSDVGDHVWRFELAGTNARPEHPHFVCEDCGTVSCLREVAVSITHAAGAPRAVSRRRVAVQLRGLCDRCAA
jgi:Fur family transcriptional regulator, ferric uptake regulator